MSATQKTITGSVKFKTTNLPVSGVKVELWDANGEDTGVGWIAGTTTDKSGKFSVVIVDPLASLITVEGPLFLRYVVTKNGQPLVKGETIEDPDSALNIEVGYNTFDEMFTDPIPESSAPTFIRITGNIKNDKGMPLTKVKVNIYENGFRTATLIATGFTDVKGNYEIKIGGKYFGTIATVDGRSIRVEVYDDEDNLIVASGDVFDWFYGITVDLVAPSVNTQNEFALFKDAIEQITGETPLAEITQDDETNIDEIRYIAGAIGQSVKNINTVVNAHKYAADTTGIPAAIFYAWMKDSGHDDNPIYELKGERLINGIVAAIDNNYIETFESSEIEGFITEAKALQVASLSDVLIAGETYSVGDVLNSIFADIGEAADFLTIFNDATGPVEDFWDDYETEKGGTLTEKARLGLKIAAITGYQPKITARLLSDLGSNHISDLAIMTVDQWITIIADVCTTETELCVPAGVRGVETSPSSTDVHTAYARRLATITQAMYPMANICAYLETIDGESLIVDLTERTQVITFLENNPDFEIRVTSVNDINDVDHDLTDITDAELLRTTLLPFGRLSRVVNGNPRAIIALMLNNVTSAYDISNAGLEQFQLCFGYLFSPQGLMAMPDMFLDTVLITIDPGPCAAQDIPGLVPTEVEVFFRADSITKGLMSSLGGAMVDAVDTYPTPIPNNSGTYTPVSPNDLPIGQSGIMTPRIARVPSSQAFEMQLQGFAKLIDSPPTSVTTGIPTLAALFGSLDYMLCSDCRSIYSPAAYLADNLNFIRSKDPDLYNNFDNKRPDIKNIDLSCDNTNTPIPAIDIVNEQLEFLIMKTLPSGSVPNGPTAFSFNTATQISINEMKGNPRLSPVVPPQEAAIKQQAIEASKNDKTVTVLNKSLAQNVVAAPNNNVSVSVNQKVLKADDNSLVSKNSNEINISAKNAAPGGKFGKTQAAYPEHLFKQSGVYNDYTAVAVTGGNAYDLVYKSLSDAVFPNSKLPFHMATDEARTYFSQFGTSRLELMRLFIPVSPATFSPPVTGVISEFSVTAEMLRLNYQSALIVAGVHADSAFANSFKFYGTGSLSGSGATFTDPVSGTTIGGSAHYMDTLASRVDLLLQQTGITYNELLQYLTTSYLNPPFSTGTLRKIEIQPILSTGTANEQVQANGLKLVFLAAAASPPVVPSNSAVSAVAMEFFRKFHAFIRLVKTGVMSIYHWDILLRSMAITDINSAAFIQIGRVLAMSDELKIEPEILALWWSKADTVNYINYPDNSISRVTSIYQDIFTDKGVVNNANTNPFKSPVSTDLDDYTYSAVTTQLANICNVKESEIIALLAYLSISLTANLDLNVLSRLYILTRLSKTFSYSVEELIKLLKLSNSSVATTGSFDTLFTNLQNVINTLKAVKISRFTADEIDYLVADVSGTNAAAPPPNKIQVFLENLRKDLARNPRYPLPTSSPVTPAEQENNAALFNQLCNIIYQHFSKEFGVTVAEARTVLAAVAFGSPVISIIEFFIDKTFLEGKYSLSEKNIAFLDAQTGGITLTSEQTSPPTIPTEDLGAKVPTFDMAVFYNCYRYVHKAAFIYQRLGLRQQEFGYLFSISTLATNQLGFDFTELPAYAVSGILKTINGVSVGVYPTFSGSATTAQLYAALLRLCRMMDLVGKLSLDEYALGKILDAHSGISRSIITATTLNPANSTDVNNAFKSFLDTIKRTDWDTKGEEVFGNTAVTSGNLITTFGSGGPLSHISVRFGIGAATSDFTPTAYKNISMVINAVDIIAWSNQIGMQPSNLRKLLLPGVTSSDVRNLITAARGKYDDAGWELIAKPLRDVIRTKQRDALVAYQRKTKERLFEDLLLDVAVEPMVMTSRIKQAISSLQLFMDRVVMGLEKKLVPSPPSSPPILSVSSPEVLSQWQNWRKWIGIWEANRKIFFYPEDWMEPELRDDKTPFFKELEAEIKQDVLDNSTAENAIANYLIKFNDIARLQPVGSCDQQLADGTIVKHVISRTYGASHAYYHRKLINGVWTPWEKVEVDVTGDHIVPFVWNGRLCIYWLTFIEKSIPFTNPPSPPSEASPYAEWLYNNPNEFAGDNNTPTSTTATYKTNYYKQLLLTLNWTEYKNGKWQNMSVGKDTISVKLSPWLEYLVNTELATKNVKMADVYRQLMNNGQASFTDFVKSRIFLYPYVHASAVPPPATPAPFIQGEDLTGYNLVYGDLYMMVTFPTDKNFFTVTSATSALPADYADYVKCFHFSGTTKVMDVPRHLVLWKRVLAPTGTYFKDQAMVSVYPGNNLPIENVSGVPSIMLHYESAYIASPPRRMALYVLHKLVAATSPAKIMTPAKSNFRLVTQAGFLTAPLDVPFFFEDSRNVFYISKKQTIFPGSPAPYTIIGPGGGGASTPPVFGPSLQNLDQPRFPTPPAGPTPLPTGGQPQLSSSDNLIARDNNVLYKVSVDTTSTLYFIKPFYHNHTHVFMRMLNQYGVRGLMRPDLLGFPSPPIVQAGRDTDDTMNFAAEYAPSASVASPPLPMNNLDFKYDGAYSVYNWELFFHIPMLIAQRLSDNMKFYEAQQWYHYIFDPTSMTYLNRVNGTGSQRFWKFYPFFVTAGSTPQSLQGLMSDIRSGATDAIAQVNSSGQSPFQPYMLGRIRPLAFMKNVVMKYLDNLIAWGDQLFTRNTIESINEATQLYILASGILGPRPPANIPRATTPPKSFSELLTIAPPKVDAIGQAVVAIESILDPGIGNPHTSGGGGPYGFMGYFCLQPNNKLLGYWDVVEDRLFKIRNSQNIQGVGQTLPLFEPPIDPELLVQAAAAGLSAADVLNDVSGANTPCYRFTYMLQKANEFAGDVKALGGSLLSALEKKDAEELAILRQGQELSMQNAILQVKQRQIDEAKANYDALLKTQQNTNARYDFYRTRVEINENETKQLDTIKKSKEKQDKLMIIQEVGHMLSLLPQFHGQFIGGVGLSFGGNHLGVATNIMSTKIQGETTKLGLEGQMYSAKAGYQRRKEDWDFQANSAKLEAEQISKQLVAAEIRIKVAQAEYDNQKIQIENATKVNDYMKFKYTAYELYNWMTSQIATTYYRAFQLANSMAKKAQLCYQRELPHSKMAFTTLITPGIWDSQRKGLVAGEQLQLDIRNMEANYIEDNKRTLELSKHVSIAMLDARELVKLRTLGFCTIDIPEEWFDMDYPGHINRTIKSVSITIPCVAGPYTTIPCTLTMTANKRRLLTDAGAIGSLLGGGFPPCSTIATSSAQNDNGMFDFNFKDERYLPFEGAGAVSTWTVSLANSSGTVSPPAFSSLDFESISDVVLHIKYTAQYPGNNTFTNDRRTAVANYFAGTSSVNLTRILSMRHEFPNEWFAYAQAYSGSTSAFMEVVLDPARFPAGSGRTVTVTNVYVALNGNAGFVSGNTYQLLVSKKTGATVTSVATITGLASSNKFSGQATLSSSIVCGTDSLLVRLQKTASPPTADVNMNDKLDDLYIVAIYKLS